MKKVLFAWLDEVGDMGALSERELVNKTWWKEKGVPPKTEAPKIKHLENGVTLTTTEGVSLGYRVFDGAISDTTTTRRIKSWDFKSLYPRNTKNTVQVSKPWKVYSSGTIPLKKGQTILVNARRIGYLPTEIWYKFK